MDFFTSLLKAYEKAEEIDLVDQQTGDNPVLLPIYHDNKVTRGASLFLVHKKVHLDYAVSDQTNRSYPNEPLTLYR